MDEISFETLHVVKNKIPHVHFLKEGEKIDLLIRDDLQEILSCEMPPVVWLQVIQTDPGAKGNTATKASKSALLETGAQIQVPLFIQVNDILKIDPATGTYLARKKAPIGT